MIPTSPDRPGVVVVVSGVPGAGKTSLATGVAAALGLPLFSLDRVKESLHDALADLDLSRYAVRLAAEAVLGGLLADSIGGAVVDVWLDPTRRDRDRLRSLLPPGQAVKEVYCDVPSAVARQRYVARRRHPHHLPPDEEMLQRIDRSVDLMAEGAECAPSGLGPVLRVDTSREIDVREIARWLEAGRAGSSAVPERPSGPDGA